jgi:drug/metabolite transporter (DMT)-like permease
MIPAMQRQTRASLYALTAVFFWSTVASAFKLALRQVSPVALLLYSSAASAAILFVILVLQRKVHLLAGGSPRDYVRSALLGLLNPFLYYAMLFKAYALLPGQEAQPLNYTWALALALLSIPLLKQRIRLVSLLAIVISLAGVYVIATRGRMFSLRFTDPLGVSLALGSSVVWALFWIGNMKDRRDEVAKLFLNSACGFAFVSIYAVCIGEWAWPGWAGLAGGAYVGVFEMGITYVLWLKALALSRTTAQVSNLIFLAPFLSLVLLHHVAGERIFPSSVAGLVLIVAGIAIQRATARQDRAVEANLVECPPD